MANKPFKKLRFSLTGDTYSPVDEQARQNIGDLSQLDTTNKSNLVEAINEAAQSGGGGTGVPAGGSKGEVLTKRSSVEGDADWEYPPIMSASGNDDSNLTVTWNENYTALDFYYRQELVQAECQDGLIHLKLVKAYISTADPHEPLLYHFEFGGITEISAGTATVATLEVVCDSPTAHSGVGAYSEVSVGVSDEAVQDAVDAYLTEHPAMTGMFTNAAKGALISLLEKVAYIDGNGQQYLDELITNLAATVTSIDAVFTQGAAVVYDTDSLDTLKQYLVVTANYSDGTSETVSTYTLSGTLTTGTSTITVSYGGQTDTFTVTVVDGATKPMPIGYTKYDYIVNNNIGTSGTGGNGICMNTDLIGSEYAKITYEHDLLFDANGVTNEATSSVYGMRAGTGDANAPTSRVFFIAKRTTGFTGPGYTYQYNGVSGATWNQLVENANFHFISRNKQIYVNDVLVADNVEGSEPYSPAKITIALWGEHRDNYYAVKAYIKMRHFIVRDADGKAVAAMYPAKNSRNVSGMYDVVRGAFYTANTASALTCGDD